MTRGPLLPSQDPFYQPPDGFEKSAPGTILKTRQLSNDAISALVLFKQNLSSVTQVLYRTNDGLNQPTVTVTTIMIPYNADLSKLVSIAEDSPNIDCAPSYSLQSGNNMKHVMPQTEVLLMMVLLGRGIPVATPDYQGPKSAFTSGLMAGQAVLDGIRAALASGATTGLKLTAQVQLWGYSGGAFASGFAAQLKKSYADELPILGAAMGGTPAKINATIGHINKGVFTGFIPDVLVGLSNQYPEFDTYFQSIVQPDKKAAWDKVKTQCLEGILVDFMFKDMASYFTRADYMADPVVSKIMTENFMFHDGMVPSFPLFMYHAAHDELVPFDVTQQMITSLCDAGANIEFVSDQLSEHITLAITGAADAVNFLLDRFQGKPFAPGCKQRTTITSVLDPGAINTFGKAIFDLLAGLLGQPVGVNSF
ncbi:secretory lipase-domain-containing protein [Gongronella butleri]|nr:secretory lipase-domain-containing protein [Gongronella butleri]